jgi:hypothetical protein
MTQAVSSSYWARALPAQSVDATAVRMTRRFMGHSSFDCFEAGCLISHGTCEFGIAPADEASLERDPEGKKRSLPR